MQAMAAMGGIVSAVQGYAAIVTPSPGSSTAGDASGAALFRDNCASCHEGGAARAPNTSLLRQLPAAAVYGALTHGVMQVQGQRLSDAERRQVAEYLTGTLVGESRSKPLAMCAGQKAWFDFSKGSVGTGWGIDERNTRFVPAAQAGLSAAQAGRLKLKWAFAYPDSIRTSSQPLLAGGAVYVSGQDGTLYALDARTGCAHWTFKASGEVRGSYVIGYGDAGADAGTGTAKATAKAKTKTKEGNEPGSDKHSERRTASSRRATLHFGDILAYVYAVDAVSGELLWKVKADEHTAARVYATPVLSDAGGSQRLYVPIASFEEVAAAAADYTCCTFRGSVSALDPLDGKTLWKTFTIPAPAVEQSKDAAGKVAFGPSGAGVWSSLTVDRQRRRLYFTTGNNYSAPADGNSDAIFALDMNTGRIEWRTQALVGDMGNMSCAVYTKGTVFAPGNDVNCPQHPGPDVDFTAPPVLLRDGHGRDMLVAAQKSGDIFGLNPQTGAIVWKTRISQSSFPYGSSIYFGMAAEGSTVFVPIIDFTVLEDQFPAMKGMADRPSKNGLYAVDGLTGKLVWSAPTYKYCTGAAICEGYQAAAMAMPGAVLDAARDGLFRILDSGTGRLLWQFDTKQEFATVNGEHARGGGMAASSFVVGNGMLYVNSGYGGVSGAPSGNALLAFSLAGH